MKPDWKDAPEWANWIAMDADGDWCWYEHKPVPVGPRWVAVLGGKFRYDSNPNWVDSLEPRQ